MGVAVVTLLLAVSVATVVTQTEDYEDYYDYYDYYYDYDYGNEEEGCTMSEWSDWGPCEAGGQELTKGGDTYREHEGSGDDVGRDMMGVLVDTKNHQWGWVAECQSANTCPQYNARPSSSLRPVPCVDGMAGDYPCRNIDMMAHVNLEDLGYTQEVVEELNDYAPKGNDIWGWTDEWTGNEYALMGTSGGTSFVDVTDPLRPNVLAFLKTRTESSSWRDIKVYNNTAYIVSEAYYHGMQVFDLLRLRDMEEFSYVEADHEYLLFGQAHNIISDEVTGFLYACGSRQQYNEDHERVYHPCKGGLHMIDARSDRLHPSFAGCYEDDGYTHDAQCVIYHGPHRRYTGHEICFNYNEDTLTIVDVTDKERPVLLSKVGYTGSMYTHQGWLTEDHTTLLLDDELDETYTGLQTHTYIWDVSRLNRPRMRALHKSREYAIDHNQYILGDISFQSNYGAGLRMMHIDQENYELNEVAYFDVLPTSSSHPSFEGTWSNYPYFNSGNIIISSIEYGLYVVRPNYDEVQRAIDENLVLYEQSRTREILSAAPGAVCPSQEELRECEP